MTPDIEDMHMPCHHKFNVSRGRDCEAKCKNILKNEHDMDGHL